METVCKHQSLSLHPQDAQLFCTFSDLLYHHLLCCCRKQHLPEGDLKQNNQLSTTHFLLYILIYAFKFLSEPETETEHHRIRKNEKKMARAEHAVEHVSKRTFIARGVILFSSLVLDCSDFGRQI